MGNRNIEYALHIPHSTLNRILDSTSRPNERGTRTVPSRFPAVRGLGLGTAILRTNLLRTPVCASWARATVRAPTATRDWINKAVKCVEHHHTQRTIYQVSTCGRARGPRPHLASRLSDSVSVRLSAHSDVRMARLGILRDREPSSGDAIGEASIAIAPPASSTALWPCASPSSSSSSSSSPPSSPSCAPLKASDSADIIPASASASTAKASR